MDNRAPDLGRRDGCIMQLLPFLMLVVGFAFFQWVEPAWAMGDNLVGQLMDQFQTWLSDKWNDIFDPIYWWYAAWILGLVAAGFIATFVPFKIVRLTLGLMLVGGALFIWGGKTMGDKNRARIERLKKQLAEEKAKRGSGGGGSQGGSGGFFDFFR